MSNSKAPLGNTEFSAEVEAGRYPAQTAVPIDPGFIDARGSIKNLLLSPLTSVAEIRSVKGAVRANHYHRTDWHYTYVVSGEVIYFERDIGDTTVPEPERFGPGQMFFTPPLREHAMLFANDSVIITFAKNIRSHDNHEADLQRVQLVSPELAARLVP